MCIATCKLSQCSFIPRPIPQPIFDCFFTYSKCKCTHTLIRTHPHAHTRTHLGPWCPRRKYSVWVYPGYPARGTLGTIHIFLGCQRCDIGCPRLDAHANQHYRILPGVGNYSDQYIGTVPGWFIIFCLSLILCLCLFVIRWVKGCTSEL